MRKQILMYNNTSSLAITLLLSARGQAQDAFSSPRGIPDGGHYVLDPALLHGMQNGVLHNLPRTEAISASKRTPYWLQDWLRGLRQRGGGPDTRGKVRHQEDPRRLPRPLRNTGGRHSTSWRSVHSRMHNSKQPPPSSRGPVPRSMRPAQLAVARTCDGATTDQPTQLARNTPKHSAELQTFRAL